MTFFPPTGSQWPPTQFSFYDRHKSPELNLEEGSLVPPWAWIRWPQGNWWTGLREHIIREMSANYDMMCFETKFGNRVPFSERRFEYPAPDGSRITVGLRLQADRDLHIFLPRTDVIGTDVYHMNQGYWSSEWLSTWPHESVCRPSFMLFTKIRNSVRYLQDWMNSHGGWIRFQALESKVDIVVEADANRRMPNYQELPNLPVSVCFHKDGRVRLFELDHPGSRTEGLNPFRCEWELTRGKPFVEPRSLHHRISAKNLEYCSEEIVSVEKGVALKVWLDLHAGWISASAVLDARDIHISKRQTKRPFPYSTAPDSPYALRFSKDGKIYILSREWKPLGKGTQKTVWSSWEVTEGTWHAHFNSNPVEAWALMEQSSSKNGLQVNSLFYKSSGKISVIQPFVEGSLRVSLGKGILRGWDGRYQFVRSLFESVAMLHQKQIIHSDLVTSNILFKVLEPDEFEEGQSSIKVKIIDFGRASLINDLKQRYLELLSYSGVDFEPEPGTGITIIDEVLCTSSVRHHMSREARQVAMLSLLILCPTHDYLFSDPNEDNLLVPWKEWNENDIFKAKQFHAIVLAKPGSYLNSPTLDSKQKDCITALLTEILPKMLFGGTVQEGLDLWNDCLSGSSGVVPMISEEEGSQST